MDILCVNCKKIIETKTEKERLCTTCYSRSKALFMKLAAIEYKGKICEICGWYGHPAGYDFHHINMEEKEFEITKCGRKSWDVIKVELDKCQLLCATCHRKIHSKTWDEVYFISYLDATTKVDFYTDWIQQNDLDRLLDKIQYRVPFKKYITANYVCKRCNKSFQKTHSASHIPQFCSDICWGITQGKLTEPPSQKELEEMHQTMSWEEIGQKYSVSRTAIYKWRKKYEMI